jgi:hypothetical protein
MAMDRNEAIAWLRSAGRKADARDWIFGKTIVLPYGEPEGGIWPGAVYLYPAENGRWHLLDHGVENPAETYSDLESACRGVLEYIARKEAALRKID